MSTERLIGLISCTAAESAFRSEALTLLFPQDYDRASTYQTGLGLR